MKVLKIVCLTKLKVVSKGKKNLKIIAESHLSLFKKFIYLNIDD